MGQTVIGRSVSGPGLLPRVIEHLQDKPQNYEAFEHALHHETVARWEKLLESAEAAREAGLGVARRCPVAESLMRSIFVRYDTDGDGVIKLSEFVLLATEYDLAKNPEDAKKLFDKADLLHDKRLSYEEFRHFAQK